MGSVNYVAEFEAFMRYAEDNLLCGRERLLWIALFHSANRRKTWNAQTGEYEWPEGFFVVTNDTLHSNACLDKRGVAEIRNSLKQRGLIDFIKGEKNKAHPQYKINYLTVGRKNAPNNAPNDVPKHAPNDAPNHTPTDAPGAPPYSNINTRGNTGISPTENQEKPLDLTDEQNEYYSNAHTREFISAADCRYLNQYRTRIVLDCKEKLDLPNDNWLTSERARMATAQHVMDKIFEHRLFPNLWNRQDRDGLYDVILDALNECKISPLAIFIMGIHALNRVSFVNELNTLRSGFYEFRAIT